MTGKKIDPDEHGAALSFPRDYGRHPDAEIEWWYVYSFLNDRYAFMACFWRYHGRMWTADGWMTTYSLVEIAGDERRRKTWIDRPLLLQTRETMKHSHQQRHDPFFEAVLELTANGDVFKPYHLADAASRESSEARPVSVAVGPCSFSYDAEGQGLQLSIDEEGLQVQLALDLSDGWFPMNCSGVFEIDGQKMWGYTHPRAKITGTVTLDGRTEQISGSSWFDHQWGEWIFENPIEESFHPMWNYYAILLDGGQSLVLYEAKRPGHDGFDRDMVYALLLDSDGTLCALNNPVIVCHDHVESLRTNNLYECHWSIEIADADLKLELSPFHHDQEVCVFTKQRGILELGCSVRGKLKGHQCQGIGFVEVFGETLDINDFFWGQSKTNLAERLESFMPRTYDEAWLTDVCHVDAPLKVDHRVIEDAIIDPIWSMMDRGGKGWRSTYLMNCCYALSENDVDSRVRDFLPIVEMLHTGSLIIDDIQDGSLLRRGQPALHTQIGEDLAINVGNFLYFLPLIIIRKARWLNESQRLAIYDHVTVALRQGHIGQALDLAYAKGRDELADKLTRFEQTRDELTEQYRLKTGSQLEAVARIAGVITQAPQHLIDAIAEYSRVFGVVFQIIDDLIDIQEGREKLGKHEGEDIRNSKLNMVLLHALSSLADADREKLIHMIVDADDREACLKIGEIIQGTAAIDECIAFSEDMVDTAWRGLDPLPLTDSKVILRSVPRWLLNQRKMRRSESMRARSTGARG